MIYVHMQGASSAEQVEARPGTRRHSAQCPFPKGSAALFKYQLAREHSGRHVYCRIFISDLTTDRTKQKQNPNPRFSDAKAPWRSPPSLLNSSTRAMLSYLHTCRVRHINLALSRIIYHTSSPPNLAPDPFLLPHR